MVNQGPTPPKVPKFVQKLFAGPLLAQQKAFNTVAFCATPGCAETQFSWCHAVPDAAQLRPIAENGKVCWLDMREQDRFKATSFWTEDATANVLVFRGFCNSCDAQIFRPIDQPFRVSDETLLLLAYRAACYGSWRAQVDKRSVELTPEMIEKVVGDDPAMPPRRDAVEVLGDEIADAQVHVDQYQDLLDFLRTAVDSADGSVLSSAVFELGRDLPFRYSVAASFARNLMNERVHVSQIECPPRPSAFLHVLEIDGTCKLILSWPSYVPKRFPDSWITTLGELSASGHLADILLSFMFINNHGLAFNPTMVEPWTPEQHVYLTANLSQSFYGLGDLQPFKLLASPVFGDDAWTLTRIRESN